MTTSDDILRVDRAPVAYERQAQDGAASYSLVKSLQAKGLAGAGRLLRTPSRQQLTVICYHRVLRREDTRFQGYKPIISASEENFTRQIDFLRAHYNPISLRDLVAWLDDDRPIPPRPVLVTFDDGYRDNAETAWPIMQERGISPVIFLATDYIGTGRPFAWDIAGYLFAKTTRARANIPLFGSADLGTAASRDATTAAWVTAMKRLPDSKRIEALDELSRAIGVPLPSPDVFRHLYLDWSDVRDLAQQGVEFGAHTQTHQILTSISTNEAVIEIRTSIERVQLALGRKPLGFAYPNGMNRDYSRVHEQAVEMSGVPVAFSLEPGPTPLSEARKKRFAIRRVYIGAQDNMPRFVAKLAGLARVSNMVRP